MRRSYWDLNPEVREFAAGLLAKGTSIDGTRKAIGAEFGEDRAPAWSTVKALSEGLASGRWHVEPVAPATNAATEHGDQSLPDDATEEETGNVVQADGPGTPAEPEDGAASVASEREAGLGLWRASLKERRHHWAARNELPMVSDRVELLLTRSAIDGCQVRGMTRISGIACLRRQVTGYQRYSSKDIGKGRSGGLRLHQAFLMCRTCRNWLTDTEYLRMLALVKQGCGIVPRAEGRRDDTGETQRRTTVTNGLRRAGKAVR